MRVGVLYSRVRVEEKLLFEELERRGVVYELLDDRELQLEISNDPAAAEKYRAYAVILERCINHSRAAATLFSSTLPSIRPLPGRERIVQAPTGSGCGSRTAAAAASIRR